MYRDYNDPRYKQFRRKVRNRDRKCLWPRCGKKSKLQVHHILPWRDYPSLRYEVSNGITLCAGHHKLVNVNEYSYVEFLRLVLKQKYG